MKRFVLLMALAYLLVLVLVTLLMHTGVNQHWAVTLWLFSPRWVIVLPAAILLPLTLVVRPKILWVYLFHALLIMFPILGYQQSFGDRWGESTEAVSDSSTVLRVLTCNLGGGSSDCERLIRLIEDRKIELVFLQECEPKKAEKLFAGLQWQWQRKSNLVIGSSFALSELRVVARYPRKRYPAIAAISCDVQISDQERIRVASVHFPTFRPALAELLHFNLDDGPTMISDIAEIYRGIAENTIATVNAPIPTDIVAGDFNVPAESVHYQDYWGSMVNAFSEVGMGQGHTKFTRWHGVRIDHVVTQPTWTPISAEVGPDLGGDHRPMMAELVKVSKE